MKINHFEWNSWNIEHVARHGIEPEEVEEIVKGYYFVRKGRNGLYTLYGRSYSGRYLLAVYKYLGDERAYVITARDMMESERKYYVKTL